MKTILLFILSLVLIKTASAQISVNQTIVIQVQGVPPKEQSRLNSTYSVSTDGTIRMWQVGAIQAAGKTQDQLAQAITAAYRNADIYTNPTFTVIKPTCCGCHAVKIFTIGGAVKAAGAKPWQKNLTLSGAIQAAGGATPFGAINRVKLYRAGRIYTYNLKEEKTKTLPILPSDIIDVPQKTWHGN